MRIATCIFSVFVLATFSLTIDAADTDADAPKPNIVFILADDMGHADLGCYGAPDAKTPHIDHLAEEGVRFTQAYAMGPECSPSRTSILTGRYPQRVGGLECAIGTGNVGRYDDAERLAAAHDLGLPADRARLAPGMKALGYATAIFGKWHIGYEPKFNPLDQGFDEFTGFLGGNVSYFRHIELSDLPTYYVGREPVEREGYLTHLITDDAIDFLKRQKAGDGAKPFFLYVPHAAPHFPFQAPGDDTGKAPTKDEWMIGSRETYVKMLEDLDSEVGRLLAALDETGRADNTLVVFASDHGAMQPGLNTPFRDYKSTLFEGGIRVPIIARWPGHLRPDTASQQVATLMDLTTSFLRIAGADAKSVDALDGIDILKHIEDGAQKFKRTLFWRSRRGDRTWEAVRSGPMKYLTKTEAGETESWLFDLDDDPEEQKPITGAGAKKAIESLSDLYDTWAEQVKPTR